MMYMYDSSMIERNQMSQILQFVSKRWLDIASDSDNKAMGTLPSDFWMNSVGGRAGKGRWVTMLMYTESQEDADAFREVLLRWQSKGMQKKKSPDLIQIGKPRQ